MKPEEVTGIDKIIDKYIDRYRYRDGEIQEHIKKILNNHGWKFTKRKSVVKK